jgi:6-phosphogluconolactonase
MHKEVAGICFESFSLLANRLTELIHAAVVLNGNCHIVFPGGNTQRQIFEQLRYADIPWPELHLYPSDERCVPVGDPQRNDRLFDELLLALSPLALKNLHRIPAELGPEEGALRYSWLLDQAPHFDIALLGVGPDGHTASLFPNHPALRDHRPAVPVRNAPKPPPDRVSIGLARLQAARERWVIVTGAEKRDLLCRVRRGEDLPVTRVRPTVFFVDAEAAKL